MKKEIEKEVLKVIEGKIDANIAKWYEQFLLESCGNKNIGISTEDFKEWLLRYSFKRLL